MDGKPHLLDQVRDCIRRKQYSLRTGISYIQWIRWFSLFHEKRQPATMSATEVEAFLRHLAVKRHVRHLRKIRRCMPCSFLYCSELNV